MSKDVWVNSKMCIKFPFEPYECQRIFMKNVVDVLDSKTDGALESPTGTGKTLSLLCATLAWVQREKETKPMDFATWQAGSGSADPTAIEKVKNSFIPTIYYASRTHSQLEQVVHELNRTSYKWVKTTILGSREHFCINPKVKKIKESNRQAHVCRGMVSKRTCHYFNKFDATSSDKMAEFMEKGQAMDIEEIVKLGNAHSMCPYFMSRQRSETAELVLLPYNYVIDPKMRRRYKLDLKNSIVIFDEAHNLESICESNASAELTSTVVAMCIEELKKVLALLVDEEETARAEADVTTEAFGTAKIDPAKKLIENLRTEDLMAVLEKIFKIEEEFEAIWKGDTLRNVPNLEGKASDGEVLLKIFETIGLDGNSVERVVDVLRDATSYLLSKGEEVALTEKGEGMEKMSDFILSIFSTHAQEVAAAVGDTSVKLADRIDPKIIAKNCRMYMKKDDNGKLHIKYFCFQASISMRMLKMRGVRNVLLASGTLSPIQSFTFNMGLNFGAILENEHALKTVPVVTSVVMKGYRGGITGSYANRSNPQYLADVAEVLIRVLDETPQGVIVFFASYSQMENLISSWKSSKRSNNTETFYEKMEKSKTVVVEPRAKDELASVRAKYIQGVQSSKGSALFAVCRGKVSEGIDFCDAESRAVVIVGVPYPPINDERVVLKRMFLDDMMAKKDSVRQSSQDWYQMEAFRAVNQAIGRVLRHKDDFGAVVLVDSRYATVKLEMFPKWLRKTISRGDTNECAARMTRFFGERKSLVEESKTAYCSKIESKKVGMFKQRKETSFSSTQMIDPISLEELFGSHVCPQQENRNIKKEDVENLPCSSSSTTFGFFLPTNEDEITRKNEKKKAEELPTASTFKFSSDSRNPKRPMAETASSPQVGKQPPAKKRIVLLKKDTSLPPSYETWSKITVAEILKEITDTDKKPFLVILKAYKAKTIGWMEVFERLKTIFLPSRPHLFIACSNVLSPEEIPKYLKMAMNQKITAIKSAS